MMNKQDFMEHYKDYSREELLDELFSSSETIRHLREKTDENKQIKEDCENRIQYLKNDLIPRLDYKREKVAGKRTIMAIGCFSIMIFLLFYLSGEITSLSVALEILLISVIGGGILCWIVSLIFLATVHKNITEANTIEKYEHEILVLSRYTHY